MRKTPVYTLNEPVSQWLEKHGRIMYTEVLESVENALKWNEPFTGIPVIILQEETGSTLFTLKNTDSMIESMDKALAWFVTEEEYEKAARARDARKSIVDRLPA